MAIQAGTLLVLFHKDIRTAAIEKLLKDFGPSFLESTQVFEENATLYAVQVAASQAVEWKDALVQLPEVVWAECISHVNFTPCHATC